MVNRKTPYNPLAGGKFTLTQPLPSRERGFIKYL